MIQSFLWPKFWLKKGGAIAIVILNDFIKLDTEFMLKSVWKKLLERVGDTFPVGVGDSFPDTPLVVDPHCDSRTIHPRMQEAVGSRMFEAVAADVVVRAELVE